MANVTFKTGLNQAEVVHAGVNAVVCSLSNSATTSAGDVLKIGRLPHQAIVLEAVFYPGAALPGNSVLKFGLSGTGAAILASATYTAVARANVNGLHKLDTSVSDGAAIRYKAITCTPTAAVSAGDYGQLVVFYKLPGQDIT